MKRIKEVFIKVFTLIVILTCLKTDVVYAATKTEVPVVRSFHLNRETADVTVGLTKKLKGVFSPEGSVEHLKWSTSDSTIAKVTKWGRVEGVSAGVAVITAYSKITKTECTCQVTVHDPKLVALTFDDGPGAYTEDLLDFLKEKDVKATFFLVGNLVSGRADTVKRMKEEGHEIGGHSYTHVQMTSCSSDTMKSEISKSNKAIKKACGSKPTLFRPPYGSYNNTLLSLLSVPAVTWSVDPLDWKYRDTDYVTKTVTDSAYDGAIILLHDIHKTSVEGAKNAITKLLKKGYKFVTVTELLSRNGSAPEAGKIYNSCKDK